MISSSISFEFVSFAFKFAKSESNSISLIKEVTYGTSRSGLKSELEVKLECSEKSKNSVSLKRSEREFPSVQSSCEKSDEDSDSSSNFGHLVRDGLNAESGHASNSLLCLK